MAKATLDKLMEGVKALTPDEQQVLRGHLDALLGTMPVRPTEKELERKLFEAGLLSEIKPKAAADVYRKFKPIPVKGKPVSETIVEERR